MLFKVQLGKHVELCNRFYFWSSTLMDKYIVNIAIYYLTYYTGRPANSQGINPQPTGIYALFHPVMDFQ